jgi:hypothetical protein
MATNPRTKTPNDAALSAVEEALRLDFGGPEDEADTERTGAGRSAQASGSGPRRERRAEPPRPADPVRRGELLRRPEGPRMPAPPRRNEPPRRIEEARRTEEPPHRPEPGRDYEDEPPPPPRGRPTPRARAANDDRRAATG